MGGNNGKTASGMRLMCIMAHPDDESLGTGGILAKYAAEGVETTLITATRGERGWWGDDSTYPGLTAMGRTREAELNAAARILGLSEVILLDYIDGEVDRVVPAEMITALAGHIRRIRPQVVVTFDPYGYYGHPDHIAIAQFTSAAIVAAASPNGAHDSPHPAHPVSKLYYMGLTSADFAAYEAAFGGLSMIIDGVERSSVSWPSWALTTHIDTSAYWQQVWEAIRCHRSQLPGYQTLLDLPEEYHHQLWGAQTLYRAYSLVNGGRNKEEDLFEGIRQGMHTGSQYVEVDYA